MRTSTSGCVRLNRLRIGGRWCTANTGRQAMSRRSRRLAPCCFSSSDACSHPAVALSPLGPHAVADCGLREVEVGGGLLEAAALGNAQEGLQSEEIDAHVR